MKFTNSIEAIFCLALPMLACAAPKSTTRASAPPITAPSSVAKNYCGVTGLNGGLLAYSSFTYNSHGIDNDEPTCENACLADSKCQSFFISVNTYATPPTSTCYLYDVPIDAYIADRGYNAGAAPPSIINYFYDRAKCFSSKPTTTTTPTPTPPASTVPASVKNKYCGIPGDLPSAKPYNTFTFSFSGSNDPSTVISQHCEVSCLNNKKCLTYMGYLAGGGYGQCSFYSDSMDTLKIQPAESSAYFWDKDKCFPKYSS